MRRLALFSAAALMAAVPVSAEISFGGADINSEDEAVFTVSHDIPGTASYTSIFLAKIRNGKAASSPAPLTCYPEQAELLCGGTVLQIRNRYGTARYSAMSDSVKWTEKAGEIPETASAREPYSVSPDGKFFCRVQRNGISEGNLVIGSSEDGGSAGIPGGIRFSYRDIPVKWSPDSSVLVYEKEGCLYFCSPSAIIRGIEIEEKYRKIGGGTINSVHWANSRQLIYIDEYIVYRINSKELYTLGLYSGITGRGKAAGKLPVKFRPEQDSFSTDATAGSLLLVQDGRLFTLLRTGNDPSGYMDIIRTEAGGGTAGIISSAIFWNSSGNPVVCTERMPYGGEKGSLTVTVMTDGKTSSQAEFSGSMLPVLSPDGTKIAVASGTAVYIYSLDSWTRTAQLTGERPVSILWADSSMVFVCGTDSVRRWNTTSGNSATVMLSSARGVNWNRLTGEVNASSGNGLCYAFDRQTGTWRQTGKAKDGYTSSQNGRYRIFTGNSANSGFSNALYIRSLSGKAVTRPMFPQTAEKVPQKQKISLVFDAYKNADGLAAVLSALSRYNITGTFFLNGEFIRRCPAETRQIVRNGHDCASMFFSTADLTDRTFIMDEDFIRRGLARNEDEFYQCTGAELQLLWHAPYYRADGRTVEAGSKAGYTYIGQEERNAAARNGSTDLDSIIGSVRGGDTVPVNVDSSSGSQNLYDKIDLLICGLAEKGFEFVPVHQLNSD